MQGHELYSLCVDGKPRLVPKPPDRVQLIKRIREKTGHFSVRHKLALLITCYWWNGISDDVCSVVRHCGDSDRVNGTLRVQDMASNLLPICRLFYRWVVDVCGPFETTDCGHKYVMVAVEHFSKYAILVRLNDKHAAQTSFGTMH